VLYRIVACFVGVFCIPAVASSQSCSPLPVAKNELWLGGGSWRGGESTISGASVDFSAFGRLAMSSVASWGGYDVGIAPSSLAVRVGGLFGIGDVGGCVYVDNDGMDYEFRGRHDVDRGAISDRVRQVGVRLERELLRSSGVEVGVSLSGGLAHRTWDMLGRRLVIEDGVEVEEVHRRERDWRAVGHGNLSVRWGRIGVAAGLLRKPTLDDRWSGYIRVGFAAIQLPG